MTATLGKQTIRYLLRQMGMIIIFFIILLITANDYAWINAWIYTSIVLCGDGISNLIIARKNPRLLASRAQVLRSSTKGFDKLFVIIYPLLTLACTITAGLDQRINGIQFPAFMGISVIISLIVIVGGYVIGTWAMMVNHHFETTVFIKDDGIQQVCTSGPYRFIRHPGYLGALIAMPAYPLILESCWAIIPTAILMAVFIIRTYLEDKTLQAELPGYKEYASSTKYRLIPHVW